MRLDLKRLEAANSRLVLNLLLPTLTAQFAVTIANDPGLSPILQEGYA